MPRACVNKSDYEKIKMNGMVKMRLVNLVIWGARGFREGREGYLGGG